MKNKKRVFVGLSGGVDSSVAAALLKRQGYDVVGVFMRFWKPRMDADLLPRINADMESTADKRGWENSCCSVESEAAARLVAGKLGISFYVFNFEREFKKAVVDYFLAELRVGRTPNPCVVCNPQIKFGLFLARAQKLGADFVATGHYARIPQKNAEFPRLSAYSSASFRDKTNIKQKNDYIVAEPRRKLFKALDEVKDQSYFLYRLNQKQLNRVLWPLGEYTKDEVYKLAKKWHLPHQARQSFDICFARDYQGFLRRHLKLKQGKIIFTSVIPMKTGIRGLDPSSSAGMTKGAALGNHAGLPFYTIGQRASVGGPGPFFVVKKDAKKNILYVSSSERDLYQKEMLVEKVNWVAGVAPEMPLKCKIKIRYKGEAAEATLRLRSGQKLLVIFARPQRAITPGQSAVFYGRGGEVLGGGIIL